MSDFADNLIDNFSTASRNVQKARSTSNLELFSEAWNSLSGYIEELECRIAELEAENKGYRMLIQDWIDIFDPQFTKRFSFIDGVRLAMIEAIKEREKNG